MYVDIDGFRFRLKPEAVWNAKMKQINMRFRWMASRAMINKNRRIRAESHRLLYKTCRGMILAIAESSSTCPLGT